MKYTATFLINICDLLEGKQLNNYDKLNEVLHNIMGMDYALMDSNLKCKLRRDIRDMMVIENGRLIYKEF